MESGVFESEGDDYSNDDFCFFSSAKVGAPRIEVDTGRRELLRDTRDVSQNSTQPTQPTHTHYTHCPPPDASLRARGHHLARLTSHFDITSHPSQVGHPSLVEPFRHSSSHPLRSSCARAVGEPKLFLRERAMLHKLLPACRSSSATHVATPPTPAACHPLGRSIRPRSSPQQSISPCISPCALHSCPLPLSQHFPSKHER
jgi:hypothetical protein